MKQLQLNNQLFVDVGGNKSTHLKIIFLVNSQFNKDCLINRKRVANPCEPAPVY
jgi:hypothetical protein